MSTKLLSSSPLRAIIGLATAALLVAGLLSPRAASSAGTGFCPLAQASTVASASRYQLAMSSFPLLAEGHDHATASVAGAH